MGYVSTLSMVQQLVSIIYFQFSYNPRSSSIIVSEPGLQSNCRKGLASARTLASLTSVAPAPELNVCLFKLIKSVKFTIIFGSIHATLHFACYW